MKHRIGFIGVGLMGHGMAKNLVEKGWAVTILGHRNRAPVEDLVKRGAKEAKSVAEIAEGSDIVFMCVTGTPEVEDLAYRQGGLLEAGRKGLIVVDTSTSQPASTQKLYEAFKAKGIRYIDAPLTRTPIEAEQGRLNTLVGADPETFAEIEPVLKGFCENVFHMGDVGAGHVVKLINNFVSIGTVALAAEAFVACKKMGADPKKLAKLMSVGAINSAMLQNALGGAAEGDFGRMKFALKNAAKDVRYFAQAMTDAQIPSVMTAATNQSLTQALSMGYDAPDKLLASLIEAHAKFNGVSV